MSPVADGGVPVGVAEAIVVPDDVPPFIVPDELPPFVVPGPVGLLVVCPVGFVFDPEFVCPQHLFAAVGTQFVGGGGGCGLLAMQQRFQGPHAGGGGGGLLGQLKVTGGSGVKGGGPAGG